MGALGLCPAPCAAARKLFPVFRHAHAAREDTIEFYKKNKIKTTMKENGNLLFLSVIVLPQAWHLKNHYDCHARRRSSRGDGQPLDGQLSIRLRCPCDACVRLVAQFRCLSAIRLSLNRVACAALGCD